MENENNSETPQPNSGPKKVSDGQIFGLNFLIFIVYTLICVITARDGGFILDAFLLIGHLIVGVILAAVYRRWAWGVSGLLAFIIGVSICAGGLGAFR